MLKIVASEDCGNSPKNKFLADLTIAFAKGDTKLILASVTEDIHWDVIGQTTVEGRAAFTKSLSQAEKVAELAILHALSHGKAGSVNGTLKLANGQTYAFCHVYAFGSVKANNVREIVSYLIKTS